MRNVGGKKIGEKGNPNHNRKNSALPGLRLDSL